MSPVSPKSTESSVKEGEDERYEQMRVEAFDLIWSKVETAIKVCTLISCNFLSLVLCSTRIFVRTLDILFWVRAWNLALPYIGF